MALYQFSIFAAHSLSLILPRFSKQYVINYITKVLQNPQIHIVLNSKWMYKIEVEASIRFIQDVLSHNQALCLYLDLSVNRVSHLNMVLLYGLWNHNNSCVTRKTATQEMYLLTGVGTVAPYIIFHLIDELIKKNGFQLQKIPGFMCLLNPLQAIIYFIYLLFRQTRPFLLIIYFVIIYNKTALKRKF